MLLLQLAVTAAAACCRKNFAAVAANHSYDGIVTNNLSRERGGGVKTGGGKNWLCMLVALGGGARDAYSVGRHAGAAVWP
jgi:hypothetical protein